jgi:hypothetical protein
MDEQMMAHFDRLRIKDAEFQAWFQKVLRAMDD